MKKANFTHWLLYGWAMAFGLFAVQTAQAQCPVGQSEITITFGSGSWNSEIGWELVNVTTNTAELCQSPGNFTPNTSITHCVTDGDDYEFRAYDSFGDGWNGATVAIAATEDGSVNGCSSPPSGTILAPYIPSGGGFSNSCGSGVPSGGTYDLAAAFTIGCPDCTVIPPADIVVNNDPGQCGAFVQVPDPTLAGTGCAGSYSNPVQLTAGPVPYNFSGGSLAPTPITISGATADAVSDVSITLDFNGDHGSQTFEQAQLVGPDGSVVLLTNSATGGDCSDKSVTATVSAATWNGWVTTYGSSFDFTFEPQPGNTGINPFVCTNTLNLTIDYFTNFVPFTNTYNGGQNASDYYPVGTTQVCYQTLDNLGLLAEGCFTVTV
ncbi:MAG: hypothetical protein D6794_03980, partial [Deltaproteobacteria bacterium]